MLAEKPNILSLAEIFELLSLPKSSTHGLMSLLVASGFVELEASTRSYTLTAKVLWIVSSYLHSSGVEGSAHAVSSQPSDELEEELLRVREAGVAIDDEEYALGVRCIAAPIRNQAGIVAAMGIRGDFSLIGDEAIRRPSRLVQDAALRTSAQSGHRPVGGLFSTSRAGIAVGRGASGAEDEMPMGARRRDGLVITATADQPGQ
jgi:DNA-binding IclR family transcriptional regulator